MFDMRSFHLGASNIIFVESFRSAHCQKYLFEERKKVCVYLCSDSLTLSVSNISDYFRLCFFLLRTADYCECPYVYWSTACYAIRVYLQTDWMCVFSVVCARNSVSIADVDSNRLYMNVRSFLFFYSLMWVRLVSYFSSSVMSSSPSLCFIFYYSFSTSHISVFDYVFVVTIVGIWFCNVLFGYIVLLLDSYILEGWFNVSLTANSNTNKIT